jgi:PAS domain S-box-containing protein
LSTDKILIAVIALLLIAVSVVIAISVFQSRQVNNAAKMVAHTQEVLIHAEKILSYTIDNETGSRGYILTGQPSFLEPLKKSQREIYGEIALLKTLTNDNPVQQSKVDSLSLYVDKKINHTNRQMSVYELTGAAAAADIVETGEGKFYSDQIRQIINKIQATENVLLVQHRQTGEKETASLNNILLSVIACILILLGLFMLKVRADFLEKKAAAANLQKLNDELEQRVKERTGELEQSKNALEQTFLRITDAFIAFDKNWRYTYLNKSAGELIQRDPASIIGKNLWEEFPGIVGSVTYDTYNTAMQEQRYMWNEDYFAPLDLWYENHVYPSPEGVSVYIRNISEKKKAEQKIHKANRLYLFISQVNQMIVRTTDTATVFKEACNIAVNLGNFKFAWIGMTDEYSNQLKVMQYAGEKQDFLFDEIISAMDKAGEIKGGTGAELIAGNAVICNDIEKDTAISGRYDKALEGGYLSYMILPLKKFGKPVGIFAYYAGEKDFFDKAEIALLEEATGDVSFALENFEKEEQRKKAESEIIREKNLSDSLINSLPGVFYLFNTEGKFLRWNKNLETVTLFSAHEIKSMHPLDLFDESEKSILAEKIANVFNTGSDHVQANLLIKTKDKIPYYFTGTAVEYEGIPCLMGVGIDFSERIKAQEELNQSTEKLHQLTAHLQNIREEERKRIGREIHDELGQQLTAIKMDVAWIEKKTPVESMVIKEKLKNIITLLDGSNQSIRRILSELRPNILDDYGLPEAMAWLGRQFTENTGIPVDFISTESELKLPEPVATCIFRLYQEALTNITRYAGATKVSVSLGIINAHLNFTVEDNGQGFDTSLLQSTKSFGILGMKERVISVKGDFRLISVPGKGTKIAVDIPLTA